MDRESAFLGIRPETAPVALAAAPNPTSDPVTVAPTTAVAGPARVEAFDALGRRVAVLHDGPLAVRTRGLTVNVGRVVAATRAASPARACSVGAR